MTTLSVRDSVNKIGKGVSVLSIFHRLRSVACVLVLPGLVCSVCHASTTSPATTRVGTPRSLVSADSETEALPAIAKHDTVLRPDLADLASRVDSAARPIDDAKPEHPQTPPTTAPPMPDSYYWTLSSLAQSVAAFIAFGLTAYVLLHTLLDRQRDDESLEDALDNVAEVNCKRMVWLAIGVVATVAVSLVMQALGTVTPVSAAPYILTLMIAVATGVMSYSVWLAWNMSSPKQVEKAAKAHVKPATGVPLATRGQYLDEFMKLEHQLRTSGEDFATVGIRPERLPFPSVRSLIEGLSRTNVIDVGLRAQLIDVSKFRNLVVHGNVSEVAQRDLERLTQVRSETENAVKRWKDRREQLRTE